MFSKMFILTTVIGACLLIAGCHKLFGGGWFYGEEFVGSGKVTFGFQAQCVYDSTEPDALSAFYEGQFQYFDKDNRVRFHGEIELLAWGNTAADCEEAAADWAEYYGNEEGTGGFFFGTCWTQPGNREGYFAIGVTDNGTPGPSAGDSIDVTTTCTPDGEEYHNEGQLGGGNLIAVGH